MSGPQLENGYTRIANEILEVLAATNLNGTQRRILDALFRQTYGWQREEHEMSLTFLSSATNIHKMQIQRELAALIDRKIIAVMKKATFSKSRSLAFNKNYSEWIDSEQLAKKLTASDVVNETVSGLANETVSELANQIKKGNKDKETDYKSVYDYYLTLGLIKHRAYTNDIAKAIAKAMKDNKYDIDYCKALLDRHKEVIEITKKKGYPVKVRGLAEFFGQKAYEATHLICSEYEEGGKLYEEYLRDTKPKTEYKLLEMEIRDNY